jgi:hypothetical protein
MIKSELSIQQQIILLRGKQTLLDRDLAKIYQVDTKVLNQAVKRNIERFPEEFRFQLTKVEMKELVTNCDRFHSLKHSLNLPYAFTEQGVAMLSSVLRSDIAIRVSIQIMKAFVTMRQSYLTNQEITTRISSLEFKQQFTDEKVNQLFKALEQNELPLSYGIFYDGEIFDAYKFALEKGIAKEQARAVLPEGITGSRMYMNGTLRSWVHYIQLRSGNGTQKEHREIALACADAIEPIFPMIKEYINVQ